MPDIDTLLVIDAAADAELLSAGAMLIFHAASCRRADGHADISATTTPTPLSPLTRTPASLNTEYCYHDIVTLRASHREYYVIVYQAAHGVERRCC